ncbi:triphosphoribosyl-dephospho-CoA synthase CitG [Streptococcus halotolerans]|uniref:triphosphoribosyl-dephospho-CoA synthase CitG n=1 Tax=Streptococcus halotolerans TaxID=1814128 RepID=UPI0007877EA1|nr:triphosphoribosyl-dephospho-CoA synthase CitG [Streptococcus halotolerans]
MTRKLLDNISRAALKSLLYEVSLSPKPGLVDRFDNGAHDDMTFQTFIDSALSLAPFFESYLTIGFDTSDQSPQAVFQQLRQTGIAAEKAMFTVTKGINTHKGVNFSLAVILGATGRWLAQTGRNLTKDYRFSKEDSCAIGQVAAELCSDVLAMDLKDLETKKHLSYGERLYLDYGITGPRGEASAGFPTVITKALPFLRHEIQQRGPKDDVQLKLLLYLMTFVEDGNLIHRGGIAAWQTVKKEAAQLLDHHLSDAALKKAISEYNTILINRHLSPGGSADLLALTLFFAFLEELI